MNVPVCALAIAAAASSLWAQPEPPKKTAPEPAPPEAVILDLRAAYSKPTAEEVTVRFRPPMGTGATERSDSFIVRVDPGEAGAANRPKAVLLELGALRVYLAAGKMVAVNASVSDKAYTRTYVEPLTVAKLAELLPPLPVPQIALAAETDRPLRSPLSQLTDITWDKGIWDDLARPPIVSMKGSGATGTVEVQVGVQSRRLVKLIATIRRAGSEGTYDLTFRAIEPGDPAKWAISTEGRQIVASLVDLRPTVRPMAPVQVGEAVFNLSLSHPDLTVWQLHEAMNAAKNEPFAVVLFRAGKQAPESVMHDARAGLAALRTVHAHSAAAAVMDIADYTRERMTQLRQTWSPQPPAPDATPIGADELLWSANAGQTIDRFSTAAAVIVVVRADKTLGGVIVLDGRGEKVEELAAEVKKAMGM